MHSLIDKGQGLNFATSAYDVSLALDRICREDQLSRKTAHAPKSRGPRIVIGKFAETDGDVVIYNKPSFESNAIYTVPAHTRLAVRSMDQQWATVALKGGGSGYISSASVSYVLQENGMTYDVTSEGRPASKPPNTRSRKQTDKHH